MDTNRPAPPYPDQITASVIGKRVQLKNIIGNIIIGKEVFTSTLQELIVNESNAFKVVMAPDFFDEDNLYLDQQLIDLMAVSYPGPHLFLLVIDSENNQKDKVLAQVSKLQDVFGDRVTAYLAIILPDIESYTSLSQTMKDHFNIWLANNESLARDCRQACSSVHPYQFDFKDYSQQVVERRKSALEGRFAGQSMIYRGRQNFGPINPPPQHCAAVAAATPVKPEIQQAKAYPDQVTVSIIGKRVQLKNIIGNIIIGKEVHTKTSQERNMTKHDSFKVIIAPDFFDEGVFYPDQQMIDFMAASHPGPHLFLLVIDSDNNQKDKVLAQGSKLQNVFGDRVTAHLAIVLPDIESFMSLSQTVKEHFHIWLANNESLARDCRKACSGSQPYRFDFKDYSQQVVQRRKAVLESRFSGQSVIYSGRQDVGLIISPPQQRAAAAAAPTVQSEIQPNKEKSFNIILLGLCGTGKSASANSILLTGDPDLKPEQLFKSQASSVPVTTECSFKVPEKKFTGPIYVVDTPDFLNDAMRDHQQKQLAKCRRFCQPGQFVVLLVMQVGRTSDCEKDILEKLENLLGLRIRESTIVLLTHREVMTGSVKEHVKNNVNIRAIAQNCGWRYHAFCNNSKDSRQVEALFKLIQACNINCPKFKKFDCGVQ